MHLLCFIAGFERLSAETTLNRIRRVLSGIVPQFPLPLGITTGILPEIQGGWLFQAPSTPDLRQRLGTDITDDLAVLFYGELFGGDDHRAARTVAEAWAAGGPNAVRDLDGCFSAIVVERAARRCTIVSDLLGRRTLRYVEIDGSLVVSTHDVAIVGTGLIHPSVNIRAVKSAAAMGWALGGTPLLDAARICEPECILQYQDRVVSAHREPRLTTLRPSAKETKKSDQAVMTAMMDHFKKLISAVAGTTGDVKCDLTAGMDTRFVLALVLSAVKKERIVAGTEGQRGDLDVVVAQRIARSAGIRHVLDVHAVPEPSKFLRSLDILAFTMNGDTDGKRAMTNLFERAEFVDPAPRFYGVASEFFRGGCYPMGKNKKTLLAMTYDDVTKLNIKTWTRIDSLPWKDKESRIEVLSFLKEREDYCKEFCRKPVDLVDIFYLFERVGRWGSFSARATWWAQYFTPFCSPTLIKLAVQLAPPLGYAARFHRRVIRQYLPGGYYNSLVNGSWFLPLFGYPRVASKIGETAVALRSMKSAATRALGISRKRELGEQDLWSAQQMGSTIRSTARTLLLSSESISSRLFKAEDIEMMLSTLESSDKFLAQVGTLLTIERWRDQMERAWRLAQGERT